MIERIQVWLLVISAACLPITMLEVILGFAFDVDALKISAVITIVIATFLAVAALILLAIEMLVDDIKDHKMR